MKQTRLKKKKKRKRKARTPARRAEEFGRCSYQHGVGEFRGPMRKTKLDSARQFIAAAFMNIFSPNVLGILECPVQERARDK